MTKTPFLVLGLATLFLSACASDKEQPLPRSCPQVAYVRDLGRIEDYGNDTPGQNTLVSIAAMRGIEGTCDYRDPDDVEEQGDGVDIQFDLKFAAEKGPRLGGDRIGFPFFVSIVNPDGDIVKKEIMTVDFTFPAGGKGLQKSEPLHVFLPLKKGEDAMGYRVLAGFQLTEAQYKALQEKAGQ